MTPETTRRSETGTEDAWDPDSYSHEAVQYRGMAARLVDAVGVDADEDVLDVACGTGNVAITAGRRGADVTGVDITPAMLEAGRQQAAQAGVDGIEWHHGDAAALPLASDTVDVTVSSLGHMYGDPPEAVMDELFRVTRPGGRIGFTSWTPSTVYPAMAGVLAASVSPEELPAFTEPPFLWGDEATVESRLGHAVTDCSFETHTVPYPTLSPEQFLEEQLAHSSLLGDVFDAVDDGEHVREQLVETVAQSFDGATNTVEIEYLLTTATLDA